MDCENEFEQRSAGSSFQMFPLRNGRRQLDLIITLGIPLAVLYLMPPSVFSVILGLALMVVLAYFFIFRKNHSVTVTETEIRNHDTMTNKETVISIGEIQYVKTGLLGDLVLIDREGKKRLCVEKNMSCYDRFQNFLQEHNIPYAND